MEISSNAWNAYIKKLNAINSKAGEMITAWVAEHGIDDRNALIDYAYRLSSHYGEAAAAITCEMYDAIVAAEGLVLESAVPADTATIEEVGKAVNGSLKQSPTGQLLNSVLYRLSKQASADTMIQNAARDHAEFAWVPSGDTCAFCITLASRGWQAASKSLLHSHADHIHANCDCTFAVRHDGKSSIKGYDPDKYLEIYEDAEGRSSADKINSIRRMKYQENKDRINAQKRVAYARKRNFEKGYTDSKSRIGTNEVDMDYIRSQEYRDKFNRLSNDPELNELLYKKAVKILDDNKNTDTETTIVMSKYETIVNKRGEKDALGVSLSPGQIGMIQSNNNKVGLHNHPTNLPPNGSDFTAAGARGYDFGLIVTHDGNLYKYSTGDKPFAAQGLNNLIDKYSSKEYNLTVQEAYDKALQEYKERFGISWQLVE